MDLIPSWLYREVLTSRIYERGFSVGYKRVADSWSGYRVLGPYIQRGVLVWIVFRFFLLGLLDFIYS